MYGIRAVLLRTLGGTDHHLYVSTTRCQMNCHFRLSHGDVCRFSKHRLFRLFSIVTYLDTTLTINTSVCTIAINASVSVVINTYSNCTGVKNDSSLNCTYLCYSIPIVWTCHRNSCEFAGVDTQFWKFSTNHSVTLRCSALVFKENDS